MTVMDNIPMNSNTLKEMDLMMIETILPCLQAFHPLTLPFSIFHFCFRKFLDTQLKFTNFVTLTRQKKGNNLATRLVRTSGCVYYVEQFLLKSQDYDNNEGFPGACFIFN